MLQNLLRIAAVAAAVAVFAVPAEAGGKAMRPFTPVEKAARAEVVFTGKVSAIAADTVMLQSYVGEPNKIAYKVATIKIEKGLFGTDKMTEVKVAFVAPPKPDPKAPVRPGRGFRPIELTEGQEGTFFLTKLPGGEYTVSPMLAPLDPKAENYKDQVELVTKAAAAFTDPTKALKAAKAEDRFLAATALIAKYRAYPEGGGETETVKIPADETKLILKGLVEGDWSKYDALAINGAQAFYTLGLTEKDGWIQPVVAPQPAGAPQVDFNAVLRDAFTKWTDGAGKNYQISRIVPKKK